MKYDFTSIMDRHGKDAIAVDGLGTGFAPDLPKDGFDIIPMWVADMSFPTTISTGRIFVVNMSSNVCRSRSPLMLAEVRAGMINIRSINSSAATKA